MVDTGITELLEGIGSLATEPDEAINVRLNRETTAINHMKDQEDEEIDFSTMIIEDSDDIIIIDEVESDGDPILIKEEEEDKNVDYIPIEEEDFISIEIEEEKEELALPKESEKSNKGITSFDGKESKRFSTGGVLFTEVVNDEDISLLEEENEEKEDIEIKTITPEVNKGASKKLLEKIEEIVDTEEKSMSTLSTLLDNIKESYDKEDLKGVSIKDSVEDVEFVEEKPQIEIIEEEEEIKETSNLDSQLNSISDKLEEKRERTKKPNNLIIETRSDIGDLDTKNEERELKEVLGEIQETRDEFTLDGEGASKVELSEMTQKLIEDRKSYLEKEGISSKPNNLHLKDIDNKKEVDLGDLLEKISKDISDKVVMATIARRIENKLLQTLVTDGEYFIVDEYTDPKLLDSNIRVKESTDTTSKGKEDKKYVYYYQEIPSEFTGHRKPLFDFIEHLKEGILEEVVKSKTLTMNTKTKENMDILTNSERETVLTFLIANNLEYTIGEDTLSIYIVA